MDRSEQLQYLLTNHARVLYILHKHPEIRIRTIAEQMGITERAVHSILADLQKQGLVTKHKLGRRNSYTIDQGLESGSAELFRALQTQESRPAVFLDRDGTLIEDRGMIRDPGEVSFFPYTLKALKQLCQIAELYIITHQPWISREMATAEEVDRVNGYIVEELRQQGIKIRRVYTCPHDTSDGCDCKKPSSFFLLDAARRDRIDLSRSFVIGDHPHDVSMGSSLGTTGLYLLTGHGSRHLEELSASAMVFHTLLDAASWVVSHPDGTRDLQRQIAIGALAIREGGLTAFPTETVYGLGADVFQPEAVRRIFEAKRRPYADPLISHVSSLEMVARLTDVLSDKARALIDAFWPGPLTLVLPKRKEVPHIVTADGPTVAVRMPSHPVALALIEASGTPIAAPSANTFGKTSPTTAAHVIDQLEGRFDAIIDGGASRVGVESTVLSLVADPPVLLRPGGVTIEQLERVIGHVSVESAKQQEVFDSPGLYPSHYAPNTPMVVTDTPQLYSHEPNIALMLFERPDEEYVGEVYMLSDCSDQRQAASRLYETMRRIDTRGYRLIVAQRLPDSGVGLAVNDRMHRASKK